MKKSAISAATLSTIAITLNAGLEPIAKAALAYGEALATAKSCISAIKAEYPSLDDATLAHLAQMALERHGLSQQSCSRILLSLGLRRRAERQRDAAADAVANRILAAARAIIQEEERNGYKGTLSASLRGAYELAKAESAPAAK